MVIDSSYYGPNQSHSPDGQTMTSDHLPTKSLGYTTTVSTCLTIGGHCLVTICLELLPGFLGHATPCLLRKSGDHQIGNIRLYGVIRYHREMKLLALSQLSGFSWVWVYNICFLQGFLAGVAASKKKRAMAEMVAANTLWKNIPDVIFLPKFYVLCLSASNPFIYSHR